MKICPACGKANDNLSSRCTICTESLYGVRIQSSGDSYQAAKNERKAQNEKFRLIIKICAAVLCVMFFLPLVRCTYYDNISASGWNIATGTGELMTDAETMNPLAFVLLIIPIGLFFVSHTEKPFTVLRNVSAGGLAAIIVFMIWVKNASGGGDYDYGKYLEFTGFTWIILMMYIGLISFAHYAHIAEKRAEDDLHMMKKKIMEDERKKQRDAEKVEQNNPEKQENPLIRRAYLSMEDSDWEKADELLEQALNQEPENAKAYIGKLCVELRLSSEEELANQGSPIGDYKNFKRAVQFADDNYKKILKNLEMNALKPEEQKKREFEEKEPIYQSIIGRIETVKARKVDNECRMLWTELEQLGDYKDSLAILRELKTPILSRGAPTASCSLCGAVQSILRTYCSRCGIDLNSAKAADTVETTKPTKQAPIHAQPEPKPESKPEPTPEPEPKPEQVPVHEPELKPEPEPKSEPEPKPKPEPATEQPPAQAQTERPETTNAAMSEPQPAAPAGPYCAKCGHKNAQDHMFCYNCGNKLAML